MRIHIPKNERGVVRIFAIDLDDSAQAEFTTRNTDEGRDLWPLRDALGVADIQPRHVEVFPVADLADIGVAGYLAEGYAIAPEDIENVRPALEALTGLVILVWSPAFGGVETELEPKPPLRLVATLQEPQPDIRFDDLPDQSAKASTGETPQKRKVSDAAMSGRIAMLALIVAFAVVGLMIWVGAQ